VRLIQSPTRASACITHPPGDAGSALIRAAQQAVAFMTIAAPPSSLHPEDYAAIEAALMTTARGRWFLCEYARRLRGVETARMLEAIERLEARLESRDALAPLEPLTLADRLMELSWSLRERGVEDSVCSKIEALAREFGGNGPWVGAAPAGAEARRNSGSTSPAFLEPIPRKLIDSSDALSALEKSAVSSRSYDSLRAESASETPAPSLSAPPPPAIPLEEPRAASATPLIAARGEALSWLDRLPLVDRFAIFA
jgi:hypothetical protein